jgi:hypothetical protein
VRAIRLRLRQGSSKVPLHRPQAASTQPNQVHIQNLRFHLCRQPAALADSDPPTLHSHSLGGRSLGGQVGDEVRLWRQHRPRFLQRKVKVQVRHIHLIVSSVRHLQSLGTAMQRCLLVCTPTPRQAGRWTIHNMASHRALWAARLTTTFHMDRIR